MSKNLFSDYRTDADLERNGIWLEEPNFRIKIARAGGKNAKFRQVQERVLRPIRRAMELGQVPDDLAAEKTCEILAEAVVLEWYTRDLDGPEDLDHAEWIHGVPDPETMEIVAPTVEAVKAALKAAPELATYILDRAKDTTIFRENFEGDVKN